MSAQQVYWLDSSSADPPTVVSCILTGGKVIFSLILETKNDGESQVNHQIIHRKDSLLTAKH